MMTDDTANLLRRLDSGDVLLFDRRCLAMWHPLSTTICGFAKLASRFDHVGIVFKIDEPTLKKHPALQEAISEKSPSNVYCLEANLNGVTVRPLEARLKRSSSNAIAVRSLVNVKRDEAFHKKYIEHVEKLLGYKYRDQVTDLMALSLDPPDKVQDREIARQLLGMRAQLANIRAIRGADGSMLHDSPLLLAAERRCTEQYNELAQSIEDKSFDMNPDKSVVCSEVVASSLQASGVLAPFPAYSSYLPRDFEDKRSTHRVVFSNPSYALGPTVFLSGPEAVAAARLEAEEELSEVQTLLFDGGSSSEGISTSVKKGGGSGVCGVFAPMADEEKDAAIHSLLLASKKPKKESKKDMSKPLLQISQAFLISSILLGALSTHQTRLQLRWANFARGGMLTLTAVSCLRIATASSLHVELAKVFDGDIRDHFTASSIDLGHPFYDLVFRGGALGFLAFAMTYPIELFNVRFHFYGYRLWYQPSLRSALAPLALALLAGTSYCGPYCWPMFYETIVPCVLPLAPSYFRGETRFENISDEEVHSQQKLGLKFALGMCALHQILVYPMETMRLRFALDRKPNWRNPYLGFRYGLLRAALTGAITYFAM